MKLLKIIFLTILFSNISLILKAQEKINYLELGVTQLNSGNLGDAIKSFNNEIEINITTPNPVVFFYRGTAKFNFKDYKGAIMDFDKAIELKSVYFEAFFSRGQIYSLLGNHTLAISDFTEAIRLNPIDSTFYYFRGISKMRLQNFLGSLSDFNKSIEISPEYAPALAARGEIKFRLGDYKSSVEDLDKAITLSPTRSRAAYYALRASSKIKLNEFAGAINDYSEAIKLNPGNADYWYFLGFCKTHFENFAGENGALGNFNKALELNPKKIEAVASNGITCEQISLEIAPNEFSAKYLATKADRLGHISTHVTGGK
jgi:tetratricopeptide (TPR) repeat protein